MKVKDAWYFNYTQKESEILQPDMAVPESHVGNIYGSIVPHDIYLMFAHL